jgi:thiol:disulfide interchange protein DsbC
MRKHPLSCLVSLVVVLATTSDSAEVVPDAGQSKSPSVNIHQSAIPGLHEAAFGSTIYYVSPDRRYVLVGDLFDVSSNVNLTQVRRQDDRLRVLSALGADDLISFHPKESVRRKLFVFADLNCGFCKRFHADRAALLEKGFEVNYLLYADPKDEDNWRRAQSVLCAENPPAALSRAFASRGDNPTSVARQELCDYDALTLHHKITHAMGVEVFPTIITDTGRVLVGYTGHEWLTKRAEAADPTPAEWSMDKLNRLRELVNGLSGGVSTQ